jgi:tRNA(Ser,Leu) C12 N-acetylase TAN1
LTDLLVSYSWRSYGPARDEVMRVLERLGDSHPVIAKSGVPGIAVVHTALDAREVVRRCQEIAASERAFRFAIKWVPVDCWAQTDLDAIKKVIDEDLVPRIGPGEAFAMRVEKRRWERYHTAEIVAHLTAGIDRPVNLRQPDRIIRLDVLGERTALSLLAPDEIFSAGVSGF